MLSTSRPILDAVDVVASVNSTVVDFAGPTNSDGPLRDAVDLDDLVDSDGPELDAVDCLVLEDSDGRLLDAVDFLVPVDSNGPLLDAVDFAGPTDSDGPLVDTVDFLLPVDSDGPLLDAVDFLLSTAADGPLRGGPNETPKPRLLNLSHSFDKNSASSALRSVRRTGYPYSFIQGFRHLSTCNLAKSGLGMRWR